MKTGIPSVLILCKTLKKGGAEKQAMMTAKLLSRQGLSVTIIIWNGSRMDTANLKYLEDQHIGCIGLRGSLFRKLVDFLRHIRHQNVTVILSYLTLANFIAALTRMFMNNLVTVGGIRSEKLPYWKFLAERFVHNRINDCTVFNSHAAKEGFERRGFNSEKSVVIHNAVTVQPSNNGLRNDDEINVISVSRFIKSKDFSTALKSFSSLVAKYPKIRMKFLIVGYGKCEKSIRMLVKEFKLESHVQLIIDPPNVRELLAQSHIYLSTSLVEGLSNSIMEAMAAGLPVVATDVGDNSYLIEDSKNGYIVPCRNADIIAQNLEELILSVKIRNEYGEYGYSKIRNEFTEEQMLGKYMDLFEKLT